MIATSYIFKISFMDTLIINERMLCY